MHLLAAQLSNLCQTLNDYQHCSNESKLMLQQVSVQLACNYHQVMIQSSKLSYAENFIYHNGYINNMH